MGIRQVNEAIELSGINEWGAGYFFIDKDGNIGCCPNGKNEGTIPLHEVVTQAKELNIRTPMIIRFPQIIKSQMRSMSEAFSRAKKEFDYEGKHFGVFPFKVNQRREFIDAIVSCGREMQWGLEVGSKTEFMAALSYPINKEALLICNGFKDEEFIEMAFIASSLGRHAVVVIEGPDELHLFNRYLKLNKVPKKLCPEIGIRVRLYSKGSGKWEKSSGETSKFGLTIVEIMHVLNLLERSDLVDKLTMLHFHIGSQITAIKRFKNALREAARVYAKIVKMGFNPHFLNIGGGVGVDYDGSKTSAQSSANYSIQEFANDAVYVIGEVCKSENVPSPNIITESGRVIAAYHSVIVTDIREVQGEDPFSTQDNSSILSDSSNFHAKVQEIGSIFENMSSKNFGECYHDAVELYEDLFTLFNMGYLSLKERAYAEEAFHQICLKTIHFSSTQKRPQDEFLHLQKLKVTRFLANFSIFQSIPDSWAIDQLFPILPISRHNEKPGHKATIVDITCDSDGCIERFSDIRQEKNELDLHPPNGEPYYLGFFLVGAYQESLANEHNLFGAINEVEVVMRKDLSWYISKTTKGDPIKELLVCRNYSTQEMLGNYRKHIKKAKRKGLLHSGEDNSILKKLKTYLNAYPYLIERQASESSSS
ncbi:MAG: biosynthetic arginine decarboxylase [Deltaproteobacteria bacterium]|nr:biosynthetic arginine decarboxylase [Deltaproteobacteria bacterium]